MQAVVRKLSVPRLHASMVMLSAVGVMQHCFCGTRALESVKPWP